MHSLALQQKHTNFKKYIAITFSLNHYAQTNHSKNIYYQGTICAIILLGFCER